MQTYFITAKISYTSYYSRATESHFEKRKSFVKALYCTSRAEIFLSPPEPHSLQFPQYTVVVHNVPYYFEFNLNGIAAVPLYYLRKMLVGDMWKSGLKERYRNIGREKTERGKK